MYYDIRYTDSYTRRWLVVVDTRKIEVQSNSNLKRSFIVCRSVRMCKYKYNFIYKRAYMMFLFKSVSPCMYGFFRDRMFVAIFRLEIECSGLCRFGQSFLDQILMAELTIFMWLNNHRLLTKTCRRMYSANNISRYITLLQSAKDKTNRRNY